eukprot:TRINITY_DN12693_c0_g1_i1.p1 TRINITY_DN12693_c0_g1~~TRINITY_DN12693_c0_g1_i1.p1  ORF type:complete len:345 (+),score=37.58 TRINITY_DN12693_c0_g1_i1:55-1035(+)
MKSARMLRRVAKRAAPSSQSRTSLSISTLGERAAYKDLNTESARHELWGNESDRLTQASSRRLGRVALVIGGTGMAGRHICQALAERHVQTFSLSRRGGISETQLEGLSYLDEVNWIEGDASDSEVWTELQPLLKSVNEVHICLPRTVAGAMLATECIRRLREAGAHPQHITMLSVPSESTLGNSIVSSWEQTERLLQHHYPKDYRVLKPDSIHDVSPKLLGGFKNWVFRLLHSALLKDESPNIENPFQAFSSLTRYHETKQSRYFAPSTHVGLIAQAAMEQNIPDLEGGEVRKLGTYELQVLPFRKLSRSAQRLQTIYRSPLTST